MLRLLPAKSLNISPVGAVHAYLRFGGYLTGAYTWLLTLALEE